VAARNASPKLSVHAVVFDVDIAAKARIEKQVPAGVMIVVVDVDAVTIPVPIATPRQVVGSHHPVGIVIEDDATGARVKAARVDDHSHVIVTAKGVRAARADAILIIIPVGMGIVRIVPAFVLALVMAVAFFVPFAPSIFAVIAAIVTFASILPVLAKKNRCVQRCRESQENQSG
jgi:hypothetical protein